MDTPKMKIFRDDVHGYIRIPQDYVENIIDTELFQRLREIEQTGMKILYPSASHDRYIHSLGTYYLGHKAFGAFRENVQYNFSNGKSDYYNLGTDAIKTNEFWDKCGVLYEIACLLHDIGHAPFSHTLEFYYDQDKLNPKYVTLDKKLEEYLGSQDFLSDFKGNGKPHERMSALVVCVEYAEAIKNILTQRRLGEDGFADIEFVVRMIIGCEYKTLNPANQIRNCMINLLNSSTIDVDSLDYIIRDSKESGIDNMAVDVERLLNSLTIVEITHFNHAFFNDFEVHANILNGSLVKGKNNRKCGIIGSGKGAFKIPKQISHGEISGIVDMHGHINSLNSSKVSPISKEKAKIYINGASFNDGVPTTNGNADIYGHFTEAIRFTGEDIDIRDEFNGKIDIEADEFDFIGTYIHGRMTGQFTGAILGNYGDRTGATVQCQLGFHKSSLSIIQNVLIARNYEYQWIFSHHKVVYYANYLLIQLLRSCVKHFLNSNGDAREQNPDDFLIDALSWKNMISKEYCIDEESDYPILSGQYFYRMTDADIRALFKKCQIDCLCSGNFDEECYSLLKEYNTRKYKKSLWKSNAEFEIFFGEFSSEQKQELFALMMRKTGDGIDKKYGYFCDEWQHEFTGMGMKNVIWVNGSSKYKPLKADETYIVFKDDVRSLKTISGNKEPKIEIMKLFYIYYEPMGKPIDKVQIKDFFKSQLYKDNESN